MLFFLFYSIIFNSKKHWHAETLKSKNSNLRDSSPCLEKNHNRKQTNPSVSTGWLDKVSKEREIFIVRNRSAKKMSVNHLYGDLMVANLSVEL